MSIRRVPGLIWLLPASFALCALSACNLPLRAWLPVSDATPTRQPSATPTLTLTPFQPLPPTPTPTPAPPTATPTTTFTPSPSATPLAIIIRGPVIQSVTLDSAIIVWDTDRPLVGDVIYGETADYRSSQSESLATRQHAVQITGLLPHSFYHYRIEAPDGPLSIDATFRTAARPEDPFSFAVVGDTQAGHATHQLVADSIVSLLPDFVLHVGDLVHNGDNELAWDTFFEVEHELLRQIPLYPSLGNHENKSSMYFDFFHLPGNERWYTFDFGNARFIALEIDKHAPYGPTSEQYAWLEETLAGNTQTWLVVYFHIPPYTGSQEDSAKVPNIRETLAPLFVRYGVDLVFNGHHHNYQRFQIDGVTYVVTGGGGGSLHQVSESQPGLVAYAPEHNFIHVSVAGGTLSAAALSAEGEALDEFSLTSHRPSE